MAKRKLEEPTTPVDEEKPIEAPEPKPAVKKEAAEVKKSSRAKKAPKEEPKEEPKRAEKKPKPARAAVSENQVHVYSLEGDVVKTIELPTVFRSPVRTDLIRRAVRAFQANRRQTYGPNRKAGMRHSVRWSGKGHGVSRVPRIRGTMIGAQAPGTVGGRKGHGPKPGAIWSMKINHKESIKARNAALAAVRIADAVSKRGHRFEADRTLPIVVENDLEALWEKLSDKKDDERVKATKRGAEVLRALGVYGDIERATAGTHIRAGRGKLRGRAYRTPTSVLVVATKLDGVSRMFRNFPGVDVVAPSGLNAEVLAPGGDPGRLTIFTEDALEILRGWAT